MEIYQLKSFCKVAEFGNLTRAAEKLFTSQPTVSAHIKALEEEFGVQLFDRSARGMKLTRAGEELLSDAEGIVRASNDIFRKAIGQRSELSGILRIGVNNSSNILHSDEIVTNLARKFPQLGFSILHGDSGDILSSIDSGEMDVGFFEGDNSNPAIESLKLGEIELCIAIPEERFDELGKPDWSKLAEQTWVRGTPTCSYTCVFEMLANTQGMQIESQICMNDDAMLLPFVASNLALCFSPRSQVEQFDPPGRIRPWPHFSHQMPLSIAMLKSRSADPPITAFVAEAREAWQGQ